MNTKTRLSKRYHLRYYGWVVYDEERDRVASAYDDDKAGAMRERDRQNRKLAQAAGRRTDDPQPATSSLSAG